MTSPSKASVQSKYSVAIVKNDDDGTAPDFIYGGPFIKVEKQTPFLGTTTPINLQLQGTFKKSFAYYSLKERLPVILTRVIDYLSREGAKIKSKNGAGDDDVRSLMQYITKLINDLVTNKKYVPLTVDTPEAKKWNEYIESTESPYYFTNAWVFTECYVYRRLREGCELTKNLKKFDPFEEQKAKAFSSSMELMCLVAEKLVDMLPASEKDKRKTDFITLLKLCLWANKCDLSLSAGAEVSLKGGSEAPSQAASPAASKSKQSQTSAAQTPTIEVDPFQMIIDLKDKVLVDDSAKAADMVVTKAEAMAKAVEAPPPAVPGSAKGSPKGSPPPTPAPPPVEEGGELPQIPCPTKMTLPQVVTFDIVCDNAGYELFTDICLAHFLVAQGIVKRVRFHVKSMPWFVSDVTRDDFNYMIDNCRNASYSKTIPPPPKPEGAEGEASPPEAPRVVTSQQLKEVAEQWSKYVQDGTFQVMSDDFWTYPHVYKDMKKYDFNMYRKLQFAVAILFKGDLNYRKLVGEKNWNPTTGFESALQGFIPAPIIACRTVKADLICGLPKGKFEQISKIDEKWMEKGDYGVIQTCVKAEPLKPSDRPCAEYGDTCRGRLCSEHAAL